MTPDDVVRDPLAVDEGGAVAEVEPDATGVDVSLCPDRASVDHFEPGSLGEGGRDVVKVGVVHRGDQVAMPGALLLCLLVHITLQVVDLSAEPGQALFERDHDLLSHLPDDGPSHLAGEGAFQQEEQCEQNQGRGSLHKERQLHVLCLALASDDERLADEPSSGHRAQSHREPADAGLRWVFVAHVGEPNDRNRS